ncbi:hypothetical protein [Nocardia suismassiliense]|uniref:hypothetical protein n=1 Tax=Nocardia suismassiliense TaxID=2077092 RepID=UPI00131F0AE1|nr:hypothetical protein [Nocardia suismassiliense]
MAASNWLNEHFVVIRGAKSVARSADAAPDPNNAVAAENPLKASAAIVYRALRIVM